MHKLAFSYRFEMCIFVTCMTPTRWDFISYNRTENRSKVEHSEMPDGKSLKKSNTFLLYSYFFLYRIFPILFADLLWITWTDLWWLESERGVRGCRLLQGPAKSETLDIFNLFRLFLHFLFIFVENQNRVTSIVLISMQIVLKVWVLSKEWH